MTFSYYPNVPNGPNDPADDQPLMQVNAQSINNLIAVDHVGFNTANGGIHKVIHFSNQVADPGASAFGQLYTKTVNATNQLFYKTPAGNVAQLTSDLTPSPGQNGYTYLPGGIILQWGIRTMNLSGGSGTGVVNFSAFNNINFPNNIFNVSVTLLSDQSNTSSNNTLSVINYTGGGMTPPTTNRFYYNFNGQNSSNFAHFYWIAIGN